MHAEMRRMPVERARHAKRLGHANRDVGSGPNFPVLAASSNGSGTPTTVQQSATSATPAPTQTPSSTLQSSSSARPSSTIQSSSASTSSTSSSTSPVAASTDTKLPTSTLPSSSPTTQLTTLVSTVSTPSTSTPQADSAAATNTGLSGGALAGIIAGSVIVGVAIIVFFIRKTYLRRRERKRISWTGIPGMGAGFSDEPKFPDLAEQPVSVTFATNAPQRSVPMSPFEPHGQSMYSTPVSPVTRMHPSPIPSHGVPTPPPATFNNPGSVAAYPTQPTSSTYSSGITPAFAVPRVPITSTFPGRARPLEAMVKCTFVPNLPDELSIMTGERVFVIEQYDDGWALCANGRGERGMVPRECLDLVSSDQPDMGWSNMRRMSSLNPDGQRV